MGRWIGWFVLVGCAGSDPEVEEPSVGDRNVAACERYADALVCGTFDPITLYGEDFCLAYFQTECDITAYFDCLVEGLVCDEATSIVTVDAAGCADLAACI